MRRLMLLFSFTLVALVAGCGTDSGSGTKWADPAASAADTAADPVAAVQQAMQRSLSSTLTIKASVKAAGVTIELNSAVDPKAKALQISGKAPEPMEARVIGDTVYLKMDALGGDKPWIKIDLTKLKPDSALRQSFDLEAQTGIIGGIVTAEKVGDGRYRGSADLDKAAETANKATSDSLKSAAKLAKDPKNIPFEAAVDGDGRLTTLSYTIATSMGDFVTDVRMSGFGEPVTVKAPPASQVGEASKEMYSFF